MPAQLFCVRGNGLVAAGWDTPSVLERRPPLSSRVPASDVVEVSSPAHALGHLPTPKLLVQWFWL